MGFEVPRGGALMITGHNGSGKTTLLRCLATALRPHQGSAHFDGLELWTHRAALRPRIALFSHDTALYEDLSGPDNLTVWARLAGTECDVDALLKRVGLPRREDPIRTYSAGMRRRLALARMLLKTPDLLLLDEPFAALDPEGRELVKRVGRELHERGATLLVSTHLPEEASALATDRIHLEGGQQVAIP